MGLRQVYLEYINKCINDTFGEIHGKRILELGNQEIIGNFLCQKTGKEYFEDRGVEHVSVDLNGLDGALLLDLTKPEQFAKWHNYFDIITNSGTTEHIEPKNAQYECFSIIHNCLKAGGIAIHLVPDINELDSRGCWKNHCNNYYSCDFFKMLAAENNYNLMTLELTNGLICACLQKQFDKPFMKDRAKFLKHISRRTGGIIYAGINDRSSGLRFSYRIIRLGYYIKHPVEIPAMIKRKWIGFFTKK